MSFTADAKREIFQQIIISYFNQHGRKELPWRLTDDPWKILTAEILLRKTTSKQALVVYEVLSTLEPAEAAEMQIEKLEEIFMPIGLYKVRAQQLKNAAQVVNAKGKTALKDEELLEALPGIGRYIRNAVRCFAFGEPEPALDTNMIRILERVFAARTKKSRAREDRELWEFAKSLMPAQQPKEYNWGILDLGAELCRPKNPRCHNCPLNQICDYYINQQ